MNPKTPPVSVIIPTRNRSRFIVDAAESVLKCAYPDFRLYIIDQSDDDSTLTALSPLLNRRNGKLVYVKTQTRGLSAARNLACSLVRESLILFTDDDCRVAKNFIAGFSEAFQQNGRIGMVFGNVWPAPHNPKRGFIPAYVVEKPYLCRSFKNKLKAEGIGACMGIRKEIWKNIGGFDESLGAGSTYMAGEETDFAFRVLAAGYYIFETPNICVIHHGFRNRETNEKIKYGYWYGTGALYAKHLLTKPVAVIILMLTMGFRWLTGSSQLTKSLGKSVKCMLQLKYFIKGFCRKFAYELKNKR